MQLTIDYPWYFILLCATVGTIYAVLLYVRNKKTEFTPTLTIILFTVRLISVTLTTFLLLSPMVKRAIDETEKPIVIIAQDNSESIIHCKDSAYYTTEYHRQLQQVQSTLREDYELVNYTYGEKVSLLEKEERPAYNERFTDLAELMTEIGNRYHNRNIGAIVIAGDGIYNRGINPADALTKQAAPIYTIAMGDTSERRDASIAGIRYNKIAFHGNQFPIEVRVVASQLEGERKTLTISHKNKVIHTKPLEYTSNFYDHTEQFVVDASEAGIMDIEIRLEHAEKEETYRNNICNIAIEVIDSRQKIAIVADAPHPDIAALQQSISQNQNYEAYSHLASNFSDIEDDYDLFILHNLPSSKHPLKQELLSQIKETPTIVILGTETDLNRLNKTDLGIRIDTRLSKINEVTPIVDKSFTYFTLEEKIEQSLVQWPPLTSPFGEYHMSGNSQTLLTAKIGTVVSDQPLISLSWQDEIRRTFITGEGLWRWRLTDYQMNGTHESFDRLMEKIITCTSIQIKKDKFHVTAGPIYYEGADVEIQAELYNENYETVNHSEAHLKLTDAEGVQKEYPFSRTGSTYRINLGSIPAGTYHYTASTSLNGTNYSKSGQFVVESFNHEIQTLKANHSLLNTLSTATGGEMLYPQEIETLPERLQKREDIQSVVYTQTRYKELLNTPLLLIIILILFSTEWILRKYNGEL